VNKIQILLCDVTAVYKFFLFQVGQAETVHRAGLSSISWPISAPQVSVISRMLFVTVGGANKIYKPVGDMVRSLIVASPL